MYILYRVDILYSRLYSLHIHHLQQTIQSLHIHTVQQPIVYNTSYTVAYTYIL